ncbi:hypothetical protein HanXRQr2_Chr06g0275331 [Helianthus annuus]|uniref:Uncharacterized protein n=1 Tax=Helianthus annuus TaxID=4232 RepID=A0A9K3NKB7_HELAN|nr:hypothetical protein HanXRQr2_Chr06g0275331 [Helianthus annuus]
MKCGQRLNTVVYGRAYLILHTHEPYTSDCMLYNLTQHTAYLLNFTVPVNPNL